MWYVEPLKSKPARCLQVPDSQSPLASCPSQGTLPTVLWGQERR